MEETSNSVKEKKKKSYFKIYMILALLVAGSAMYFVQTKPYEVKDPVAGNRLEYDENARDIVVNTEDKLGELNSLVAEGMIRITINPDLIMDKEDSSVNVGIVNHPSNLYPQVVSFTLEDIGEVYKSKAIPVGKGIETVTLDTKLEEGTYEGVAYFTAVNTETLADVGTAGARIRLTIE